LQPIKNGIIMKPPRKYETKVRKYRTLARGYAALNSKLAGPAKGAAKAYEHLADRGEPGFAQTSIKQDQDSASPGR